jgi:hypothetical protein
MQLMNLRGPPRTADEALARKFEFWSTQPVPKMGKKERMVVLLVVT